MCEGSVREEELSAKFKSFGTWTFGSGLSCSLVDDDVDAHEAHEATDAAPD